jgi:CPA1 family monovalent cation:H+ antiporter
MRRAGGAGRWQQSRQRHGGSVQTVTIVLAIALAVTLSGFLVTLLPVRIPLPLIHVALGLVLSLIPGFSVTLEPELFFVLFIPPLLFLDGWRIPKHAFFRDLRLILPLAVGLVFFTVLGVGLLIGWLLPVIPLAAAFALAAILSPTDPVAVTAIAERTNIPARLMNILEGEALLNDASGLVSFRFAVAAAMTGGFSLAAASTSFLITALGGILVGAGVCWGIGLINNWLSSQAGEEPGTEILVSLLIPFLAYLAAEKLGVSGILSAAAAGITMQYTERFAHVLAITRLQRNVVWNNLQIALNGAIFVLLGEQLPLVLNGTALLDGSHGAGGLPRLLFYAIVITLALSALRFIWVWTSLKLPLFNPHSSRRPASTLRIILLAAFAGVKGEITMAGILTLPLLLPDGSPFPARNLLIGLAMAVIVLSLIMASIALPWLARGATPGMTGPGTLSEAEARSAAAEAAIRRIEQLRHDANSGRSAIWTDPAEVSRIESGYRRRLKLGRASGQELEAIDAVTAAAHWLRIEALHAERDELQRLRLAQRIDDDLYRQLIREVDLREESERA